MQNLVDIMQTSGTLYKVNVISQAGIGYYTSVYAMEVDGKHHKMSDPIALSEGSYIRLYIKGLQHINIENVKLVDKLEEKQYARN